MRLSAFRLMFIAGMLAALDTHSADVTPGGLPASSQEVDAASTAPVRGRIIVKYRDSVEVCVHCWHKSGQGLSLPTSDLDHSLDGLHARYAVRSVTPLFRSEAEEQGLGGIGGIGLGGLPSTDALRHLQQEKLR